MIPDSSLGIDVESGATESDEDFANEVNSAKDALLADNDAEIAESSPVYDGVIPTSNLKEAIPSFDMNSTDTVQVYDAE
jgi:hypothetical protein